MSRYDKIYKGNSGENIILIGSKRKFYKILNIILKDSFDFYMKETTNVKKNFLFCNLIVFLKLLTSDKFILDKTGLLIIEELELHFLIDKLIYIYSTKVKDNMDDLLLGNVKIYFK